MRHPQAALTAPAGGVPGLILQGQLRIVGYEGLVLDDQGDGCFGTGDEAPVDQRLLGRVLDDVGRSHAAVDVQAGDAPGMVVVEHQPGALLVGVVEGHLAIGGIAIVWHIRHRPHAGALRVGGVLAGGRDPLVRRAVADPG